MTLTAPDVLESLDFHHDILCESSHEVDAAVGFKPPKGQHPATWFMFKECGHVAPICDIAQAVHEIRDAIFGKSWICRSDGCEYKRVLRFERIPR